MPDVGSMVTNRRRRAVITALALYTFAALFVGYFAVNAFTGSHGLRAQQDLDQQLRSMQAELDQLKAERALWERRVALLRSDNVVSPGAAGLADLGVTATALAPILPTYLYRYRKGGQFADQVLEEVGA